MQKLPNLFYRLQQYISKEEEDILKLNLIKNCQYSYFNFYMLF